MSHYRTGTVNVTNGSLSVVGVGTDFIAGAAIGECLAAPDGKLYEIASIQSATALTLGTSYLGSTVTGQAYSIIPTQSYIRDLALQAATLVNGYQSIVGGAGSGKFDDGTVGSPGIQFAADANTGIRRTGTDAVAVVTGGVDRITVSSAGVVAVPGNTALGDAEASDTHAIKGATTILANSASAALTVTQTGAGNAFVVEDSASTDSTPFVIGPDGRVTIGAVNAYTANMLTVAGNSANGLFWQLCSSADNLGFTQRLIKNRNTDVYSNTVVQSGDSLGRILFAGADGTTFVDGASIQVAVDGTPGTNDMPGRLVFSTTADGASSPTEAMRIDNTRKVHIGSNNGLGAGALNVLTASGTATAVYLYQASVTNWDITIPASTNALTFNNAGTERMRIDSSGNVGIGTQYTGLFNNTGGVAKLAVVGSSASTDIRGNTEATLAIVNTDQTAGNTAGLHFARADTDDTPNYAGASIVATFLDAQVTGQYPKADLVFLNSTTANTAPSEKMRIDSAGNVGIGGAAGGDTNLQLSTNLTGATTAYGFRNLQTVQPGVTTNAFAYISSPGTAAAAFTLTHLHHFNATPNTFGASSAVTNQYGFTASSSLTGATNNYGFYSNIAAAANRFNFYAAGTADNYFAGKVGIGIAPTASTGIYQVQGPTGALTCYGHLSTQTIQSDVTSAFRGFQTNIGTAAAAFTIGAVNHFLAGQATLGASSAITTQVGFLAASANIGATTNIGFSAENTAAVTAGKAAYGFYSAVNTASGGGTTYGFYAAGTAANYFGGMLTIGSSQDYAVANLVVNGSPSMNTSAIMGIANNVTLVGGASTTQYRGFSNELTYTPAVIGGTGFGFLNTTQHNNNKPVATHYQNCSRTDLATAQLGGTIGSVIQYGATSPIFNAAATTAITNYYGFNASNVVQGALQTTTNIYGFYSNQAAGTNRYNFYAAGTADNYFDGKITSGTAIVAISYVHGAATVATPAGGAIAFAAGVSALGVYFGSGVPTVSAAQGSLYMRSDGSSTSTRMYVNTNGTTGWTAVTTAT